MESAPSTYIHIHSSLGSMKGLLVPPSTTASATSTSTSISPSSPSTTDTDADTSIIHFRSIPYAHIPARFKPSTLLTSLPSPPCVGSDPSARPPRDFTTPTFACPQTGGMGAEWGDAYGGRLAGEEDGGEGKPFGFGFDEFGCVNLSVAVPRGALAGVAKTSSTGPSTDMTTSTATSKDASTTAPLCPPPTLLPVMVYVHGGGLAEGTGHIDGLHSGVPLTAFSVAENMPAIVVNVGYRLNWLGFLACSDLLEEARLDHPDSKLEEDVFNVGLSDQRTAFRWIKQQIAGFGGDPGNITAFGESAGSISLAYHLCGDEPLFKRVILQSGMPFGTMSLAQKDGLYHGLLAEHGIKADSAKERLDALRKIPAVALAHSKAAGAHVLPCFHGGAQRTCPRGIPSYSNVFKLVAECAWIEDVVVGDAQWEGAVFLKYLKDCDGAKFVAMMGAAFGQDVAAKLLAEYDIAADTDRNLLWHNVATLMGDMFLSEPMATLADTVSMAATSAATAESVLGSENPSSQRTHDRNVYRYTFALTNPFPGSDCSFVTGHHFVEILFLFLTLCNRYPKHRDNFLLRQAQGTARRWIAFANGKAPWPVYVPVSAGGDGMIAICDDRVGWTVRSRSEDNKVSKEDPWGPRRYRGMEVLREAFAALEKRSGEAGEDLANHARLMVVNATAYKVSET